MEIVQVVISRTIATCLRAAMPPPSLHRELLLKEWVKFITSAGIPMSPGMNDPLKVGCVLKLSLKELLNASVLRACSHAIQCLNEWCVLPPQVLVDEAQVATWVREGLPADPTSVQSGAILTNSGGWQGLAVGGAP